MNSTTFQDTVMNDEYDVITVFYSVACESCAHFAVYYKRMALRFKELNIKSLLITRMDVSNDSPPTELNILVSKLPLMVICLMFYDALIHAKCSC